jgi:endoglucanase
VCQELYEVALAFLKDNLEIWKDNLEIWKDNKWGWAMWCFRGSFGVAGSGRKDIKYENYKGLMLDRKMVELLKSF